MKRCVRGGPRKSENSLVWAVLLSVGKRYCLGRKKGNLQATCEIQKEKADKEEFCIMNKTKRLNCYQNSTCISVVMGLF